MREDVFLGFPRLSSKINVSVDCNFTFLPRDKSVTQMYQVSYYADCCILTVTSVKKVFCCFILA